MKIKGLLVATALFAMSFVNAQQRTYIQGGGGLGYMYTKKAESQPATGSQYYIELFSAAKIDDAKEIALVRYNAHSDEMELKIHEEIVVLEPKDKMLIKLMNKKANYTFVQYQNEDDVASQGYLVVISDNSNVRIFKREIIKFVPEEEAKGGYIKYKPARYKKESPEYYIQLNNGEIVYMPTKRKKIMKLIPGKEKEIKAFMKENRIKTSRDKDLEKLGHFMSTLL